MRQSQALVMTPQLMQAIKLLQLSNLDLSAYVEGELERNPLLELAGEGEPVSGEPQAEPPPAVSDEAPAGEWMNGELEVSRSDIEAKLGTELENVFPDDSTQDAPRVTADAPAAYSQWSGVGAGGHDDSDYNLEAFV